MVWKELQPIEFNTESIAKEITITKYNLDVKKIETYLNALQDNVRTVHDEAGIALPQEGADGDTFIVLE
jgi:hypothetical protein